MKLLRYFLDHLDDKAFRFMASFFIMICAVMYRQLLDWKKFVFYEFVAKLFWGVSVVFGFIPFLAKDLNLTVEGVVAATWIVTFFPNHFISVFFQKFMSKNVQDCEDELKGKDDNLDAGK